MNALAPALFAADIGCLPCCNQFECACALEVPPFSSPYPDYATAATVVADMQAWGSCYFFLQDSTGEVDTVSVTDDGTDIVASVTFFNPVTVFGEMWLSITASSGDTFSVAYTGGSDITVVVYACDGTIIETVNSSSSPASISALPASGTYYFKVSVFDPPFSSTFTAASFTITPSATYVLNPSVVLWDDSGTTRKIEVCPKFLLPPFTESSGDWFVDESEASSFITEWITDCLFYGPKTGFVSGFSATYTETASGVDSDITYSGPAETNAGGAFFSVSAEEGESVTLSWTGSSDADPLEGILQVFDDSGTLVLSNSSTSSPITVNPIPSTGRYLIIAIVLANGGATAFDIQSSASVSGVITLNPAQALYDVGLDCPARLDCE